MNNQNGGTFLSYHPETPFTLEDEYQRMPFLLAMVVTFSRHVHYCKIWEDASKRAASAGASFVKEAILSLAT